jgi:hypothetical protein
MVKRPQDGIRKIIEGEEERNKEESMTRRSHMTSPVCVYIVKIIHALQNIRRVYRVREMNE